MSFSPQVRELHNIQYEIDISPTLTRIVIYLIDTTKEIKPGQKPYILKTVLDVN